MAIQGFRPHVASLSIPWGLKLVDASLLYLLALLLKGRPLAILEEHLLLVSDVVRLCSGGAGGRLHPPAPKWLEAMALLLSFSLQLVLASPQLSLLPPVQYL